MATKKVKKTILIMDDEPEIIELVEHSILGLADRYDFDIHKVGNGKDGLEKIQNNQYSLIITDIKMPEVDGNLFIEEKATSGSINSKTPLIVITGFAYHVPVHESIFVVEKPFNCKELKNMIRLHLNSDDLDNNLLPT